MEPAQALELIETTLRTLVKEILNDDWLEQIKDVDTLEERRQTEQNQRDGVMTSEELLDYTMLYQLHTLIIKRWESFKPVFGEQSRFKVWMSEVDHVRGAIAHSRALLDHERDLISGIAGQIDRQATLYRTNELTANGYYPLISFIRDGFGQGGIASHYPSYEPVALGSEKYLRLTVGQTVSFECAGQDPRGREIEWRISTDDTWDMDKPDGPWTWTAGNTGTLTWTVREYEVREEFHVSIEMRTKGAQFHRLGLEDDRREFTYAINPPLD